MLHPEASSITGVSRRHDAFEETFADSAMTTTGIQPQAEEKVFNDCVHGHIKLHPMCVKIIDTPQFQRLRNLKQVSVAYLVYPGASHNRFEHSLGVCYLAGQMVEALRRNSKEGQDIVTDEEKLCVEIAGLCHDLGHGPFSHTWECFLRRAEKRNGAGTNNGVWKHESASVEMLEYLLEANNLKNDIMTYFPTLKEKGLQLIKELIYGEGTTSKKLFLYEIVSNKLNGIDVDRWDYFLRDGQQLNLKTSFNYRRLLEFCCVASIKDKDDEKHICFRDKERRNIYDMFQVRSQLFYRAYQHNVVLILEEMLIDAFLAAERFYAIEAENKSYRLSEAHRSMAALSQMTDHIYYNILYSKDIKLKPARDILLRIQYRNLYRIVGFKNFSNEMRQKGILQEAYRKPDPKKELKALLVQCESELNDNIQDVCKEIVFFKDWMLACDELKLEKLEFLVAFEKVFTSMKSHVSDIFSVLKNEATSEEDKILATELESACNDAKIRKEDLAEVIIRARKRMYPFENELTFLMNILNDIKLYKEYISDNNNYCDVILQKEDFGATLVRLDTGFEIHGIKKGELNPFGNIYFYGKNSLEQEVRAKELPWNEVAIFCIPDPEDSILRIDGLAYYKGPLAEENKKIIMNELRWLQKLLSKRWGQNDK